MNKKAILVVTLILGLAIFVPLVAAAPYIQNSTNPQTQNQLQQGNGTPASCLQAGTAVNCRQNQNCTQNNQCLNSGNGGNVCTGAGVCNNAGMMGGMMSGQQNHMGGQFRGRNCQTP